MAAPLPAPAPTSRITIYSWSTNCETHGSYLVVDKHRTATLAIDAGDQQTFVKRSLSPFGQQRDQAQYGGPWIDDKAFLGKPHDLTTGLTHIGAREYNPDTGMFLSVDPLLETGKPQTLNGYSYGAQNPYTYTDPTGKGLACGQPGMPGCGDGVVTHADGSTSNNGSPTGGGILPGYNPWDTTTPGSDNCYGGNRSASCGWAQPTNTTQRATALAHALQQAQARAQKKKAANESTWSKIWGAVYEKSGAKNVVTAFTSNETTGICISFAGGVGIGGSVQGCLLSTTYNGETDYGLSFTHSIEDPSVGLSAGVSWLHSNATDLDQIRGRGVGSSFTAAAGAGISLDYEEAIGVTNDRGKSVVVGSIGLVAGGGLEGSFGGSQTYVLEMFTVSNW